MRKRSVVMTVRGGLDRHGCGHLSFSDDEREWIDESQWQSEVIVVSEPDSPGPGPTVSPDSSHQVCSPIFDFCLELRSMIARA